MCCRGKSIFFVLTLIIALCFVVSGASAEEKVMSDVMRIINELPENEQTEEMKKALSEYHAVARESNARLSEWIEKSDSGTLTSNDHKEFASWYNNNVKPAVDNVLNQMMVSGLISDDVMMDLEMRNMAEEDAWEKSYQTVLTNLINKEKEKNNPKDETNKADEAAADENTQKAAAQEASEILNASEGDDTLGTSDNPLPWQKNMQENLNSLTSQNEEEETKQAAEEGKGFRAEARGENSGMFSQLLSAGSEIFEGMKMIIYAVAGFGIVAIAIGGFFGNFNFKWLSAIIIGLIVISMMAGILSYMTESDLDSSISIQDSLIKAM